MAERVIIWTKTAASQRREILRYWVRKTHSTGYSKKLIKEISNRTKIIALNPESFVCTNYPATRISAMGHYSILYKYDSEKIYITAFWDNRQDPKKLIHLISKY